jgi:dolichol-phosphate mannosyltransferase
MKQKIQVILPSYNEALNLPKLLHKLDQFSSQVSFWDVSVIIVNDGSKDNTVEVVNALSLSIKKDILDLQPNRGLAGAMREGIKYGIKDLKADDILVALDADDSHNPFLIERLCKQINEGSDVVIASRYQYGARIIGLSKFREFASWCAGFMFRVLRPIKGVKDYTCGFRAYRVSKLKATMDLYGESFIEEQGFACMAEILIKLAKQKAIIHEMPMILRYDLKLGDSKMNFSKTVKNTIRLAFKKI